MFFLSLFSVVLSSEREISPCFAFFAPPFPAGPSDPREMEENRVFEPVVGGSRRVSGSGEHSSELQQQQQQQESGAGRPGGEVPLFFLFFFYFLLTTSRSFCLYLCFSACVCVCVCVLCVNVSVRE